MDIKTTVGSQVDIVESITVRYSGNQNKEHRAIIKSVLFKY